MTQQFPTTDGKSADESHATAKPEVARMFDRISPTYDFLNRFFSLGVDRSWRKEAIRSLKLESGDKLLDCSAGTGDMAITAARSNRDVRIHLLDPARAMLAIADGKAAGSVRNYSLAQGAAESLPYADESFDHFTVAFGIRNFADLKQGMAELCRVLKRGGSGAILEFTPDRSPVIDRIFRFYMWGVMRPIGGLISRDRDAYAYLARTVQNFPTTDKLRELFLSVGFSRIEIKPRSLGIACRFLLHK